MEEAIKLFVEKGYSVEGIRIALGLPKSFFPAFIEAVKDTPQYKIREALQEKGVNNYFIQKAVKEYKGSDLNSYIKSRTILRHKRDKQEVYLQAKELVSQGYPISHIAKVCKMDTGYLSLLGLYSGEYKDFPYIGKRLGGKGIPPENIRYAKLAWLSTKNETTAKDFCDKIIEEINMRNKKAIYEDAKVLYANGESIAAIKVKLKTSYNTMNDCGFVAWAKTTPQWVLREKLQRAGVSSECIAKALKNFKGEDVEKYFKRTIASYKDSDFSRRNRIDRNVIGSKAKRMICEGKSIAETAKILRTSAKTIKETGIIDEDIKTMLKISKYLNGRRIPSSASKSIRAAWYSTFPRRDWRSFCQEKLSCL